KLRTVIWDFGGEPIPRTLLDAIKRLVEGRFPAELAELLAQDEQKALLARGRARGKRARFPKDASGRRYPMPLVSHWRAVAKVSGITVRGSRSYRGRRGSRP